VSGWPSVAMIIAAEIAAAGLLVRQTARRWWDYLLISVLTAALVRPAEHHVTGDISRYLPDAIWSGSDDKEQIIYVRAASTVLLPLIASALVVFICSRIWRGSPNPDKRDGG
jgi:hypothetical protein